MPTLPPLATLAAMGDRLGVTLDPSSADGIRATAALNDASSVVRTVARRTWVDEDGNLEPVPPVVEQVVLAAAIRVFRNPDGFAQASVGDVSVSYGSRPGGSVFLTREEKRAVMVAAGATAARSLGITSGWVVLPTHSLDDEALA
jgi:hypothetical protein